MQTLMLLDMEVISLQLQWHSLRDRQLEGDILVLRQPRRFIRGRPCLPSKRGDGRPLNLLAITGTQAASAYTLVASRLGLVAFELSSYRVRSVLSPASLWGVKRVGERDSYALRLAQLASRARLGLLRLIFHLVSGSSGSR